MNTLHRYYRLTKPGIVYGNALAAMAGYFFGAHGNPSLTVFLGMVGGISAVMASACVFNNVMDKDIDKKMARTKNRALALGTVSTQHALLYATVLLAVGVTVLLLKTNVLATAVAIGGHIAYVIVYGYAKRKTVHGTLVGTLSGSTPPVIGYLAATGHFDSSALLLFILLAAWQMPHFFAIAVFRRNDYASASIPVISVVRGLEATRRQIIWYVLIFIGSCIALGLYGGASLLGTLTLVLVGGYWLYLCLLPATGEQYTPWARTQFKWSLSVLLVLCGILSVDHFLH